MSRWTHLAGIVRMDKLPIPIIKSASREEILELFRTKMPRGSEGPPLLHVHTWKRVPIEGHDWEATDEICKSGVYWGDLIISADLRDYGDDDDIKSAINWFREACDSLENRKIIVRQAILQIEDERLGTTVLSLNGKDEGWVVLGIRTDLMEG